MAIPVTVPRLGWSMDEGTFVEWLKRDGEMVRVGEPLFVLESEKAAEPIEALDAGILRLTEASPKAGEVVRVGQILAFFAAEGEQLPTLSPGFAAEKGWGEGDSAAAKREPLSKSAGAAPSKVNAVLAGAQSPLTPTPFPPQSRGQREGFTSSPRARRVARELGVDIVGVPGTGRGGRVRERDVRAAATSSSGKLIPHSRVRRIIATRMVAGVTQAAPVTLTAKIDATRLVNWRESANSKPSYTDLLVALTAKALREHPLLQAQWRDDGLFVPDHVHVAIGVDTDAGLFAPVIRDADRLSVEQIAAISRELIDKARSGRLSADEQRDATFTITNLGMFGIDAFTPIIHLPQCAVLGVGRIVKEPAVFENQIVPRDMLTLSLTFDHRVVDGAPAARFLQTLAHLITGGAS